MLGWAPASDECQPALLDAVIDDILQQGQTWLSSLSAPSPVKTVSAMRPATMGNQLVQRLHDRIYARAVGYASGRFIQLVRERPMGEGSYWELQIVS